MTSSAKLQNQADTARAGLSSALDELRNSVTTTALTNGAMTFAKDGSSALAKAAVDKAMANPLGAMLIGAGLFMLMSSDKSSPVGGAIATGNDAVKSAASAVGGVGSKLVDAASSAYDATKAAAGSAVGTVKSASDQVTATAASAADKAKGTYAQAADALGKAHDQGLSSYHDAQDAVMQAKTRLEQFAAEQPVLVAALGVAFGAALGASLPVTAAERTYMGDATKKLVEKGTGMAKVAADAATGTLAGENVSGKIGELTEQVGSALTSGAGS